MNDRVLKLVVILIHFVTGRLDFTTIYQLSKSTTSGNIVDDKIFPEIHLRTNALGRLLKMPNGTYIEPETSIGSLGCFHAATICTWKKYGKWMTKKNSMKNILTELTLKLDGTIPFLDSCEINNGECQVSCTLDKTITSCSCPQGYSLEQDQKTCKGNTLQNKIFSNNSGELTASKSNVSMKTSRIEHITWLIIAPRNHLIKLKLHHAVIMYPESVNVYDGQNNSHRILASYDRNIFHQQVISTQNKLLISLNMYHINSYVRAEYKTEMQFLEDDAFLSLISSKGTLQSPLIYPDIGELCVSIIYKGDSSKETIQVVALFQDKHRLPMTKKHVHSVNSHDGMWKIDRFTVRVPVEEAHKPLFLLALFVNQGSGVFSIVGCSQYGNEDIYKLMDFRKTTDVSKYEANIVTKSEEGQTCFNGGIPGNGKSYICYCPPGFTGHLCEKGCGLNSYGYECEGICSEFAKGCLRMIMCVEGLPCMCAPGFTGEQCDEECSPGNYGANCRQHCGNCKSRYCDLYTGICHSGCIPGYEPPLCQKAYGQVSVIPKVEHVYMTMATIGIDLFNVSNLSTAKFYQVQFKEKNANYWSNLEPRELTTNTVTNITHLKPGILYQIRAILLDAFVNYLWDTNISILEFETLCIVPTSNEYHLKTTKITYSSFEVHWKYPHTNHAWCPVTGFEVTVEEGSQNYKYFLDPEKSVIWFYDLKPGTNYSFELHALTKEGEAPSSAPLFISTNLAAPSMVVNLRVKTVSSEMLSISWEKPGFTGGTIFEYQVEYQCVQLMACSKPCNGTLYKYRTDGNIYQQELKGLIPYAQYVIRVAGRNTVLGLKRTLYAITEPTVTTSVPHSSVLPVIMYSRKNITLQWEEPSECVQINGPLLGYWYEFFAFLGVSANTKVKIRAADTKDTYVHFSDLLPQTKHECHVHVLTSVGWNPRSKLIIPFTTNITGINEVQGLIAYKKGPNIIGIRWAMAAIQSGSETLTYWWKKNGVNITFKENLQSERCLAWPQLYCQDIVNLAPNITYTILVKRAVLQVTTIEEAPGVPESLRVLRSTQTSIIMEWKAPYLLNGILRSYIVCREVVDQMNASLIMKYSECNHISLKDENAEFYQYELSGLESTTAFSICVSAITTYMGPGACVFGTTAPNPPTVLKCPKLVLKVSANENDMYSVRLEPITDEYPNLQSTYLVLLLHSNSKHHSTITDKEVLRQLQTVVNQTYFLIGEYTEEDLLTEKQVNFGSGTHSRNGKLGQIEDPVLLPGVYRTGIVLVLDYLGAKTATFQACDLFTVK